MAGELINGLFALGGAAIGVAGTWIITHRYREKKQLTVVVTPLAKLLDVGDLVKADVKISFKEQPVNSLFAGEVAIINTGNAPVQGIDATVATKAGALFMDFEIASTNYTPSPTSISITGDEHCKQIAVDYLNQNDRVVLGYKLAGHQSRPEVTLRKIGVEVITKQELVNWIPDLYAEAIYAAFSERPMFNVMGGLTKSYKLYLKARRERERDQ